MRVKRIAILGFAMLAVMLMAAACAGPQGAVGPAGPPGPQGPAGPAGEAGGAGAGMATGAAYVGAETCQECHAGIYDVFIKSGHAWKLNPVVDGQPPDYPFTEVTDVPEGYTWDDILYVIGGYNWKARFVGLDGYIITNPPGQTGVTDYVNQYNFANPNVGNDAGWTTYHSGDENVPYNCGSCHTTGYSPEGHQDGVEGLVGTWSEPGVWCEECHGPGSDHAQNPMGVQMNIDRDSEMCGSCHRRGDVESVNASGGFIQHHEQYEELYQSKHLTLRCVTCHDPHEGVIQLRRAEEQTTRTLCENCHWEKAEAQSNTIHLSLGVECIECHMPRVTKSAVGNAAMFTGDIRTHLMAIDPGQIAQFNEDGSAALSQIGLDFACRHCHVEGGIASVKTDQELTEAATGYHSP